MLELNQHLCPETLHHFSHIDVLQHFLMDRDGGLAGIRSLVITMLLFFPAIQRSNAFTTSSMP